MFNDMVRQEKVPTPPPPHSLKALGNVSNIKRGTLTFLVMGLGGVGVMNLGSQLCFFRTLAK